MSWRKELQHAVDPNLPFTEEELGQLLRDSQKRFRPSFGVFALSAALVFLPGLLLGSLIVYLLFAMNLTGVPGVLGLIVAGVVLCASVGVSGTILQHRPWYVRSLRLGVRKRGYEVCLKCGYWLRELPEDEDRCPECGAKRRSMPETGGHGDNGNP
jgi:hypothetical protein